VAGQALSALADRVADGGVALQLVQSVSGVLDGSKEGKVKVAAERTALANALAALAPLPAVPGMEQPATAAATFCSTYYKDERECGSSGECGRVWLQPCCSVHGCVYMEGLCAQRGIR
jgi:hypothetical protein